MLTILTINLHGQDIIVAIQAALLAKLIKLIHFRGSTVA